MRKTRTTDEGGQLGVRRQCCDHEFWRSSGDHDTVTVRRRFQEVDCWKRDLWSQEGERGHNEKRNCSVRWKVIQLKGQEGPVGLQLG